MTTVVRRTRTTTFPRGICRLQCCTALILVLCTLVCASPDNYQRKLETLIVKEQSLVNSTHNRITDNISSLHRRARDVWRSPVQDYRRISSYHGTTPYLRRRYSSTNPWISLYQEHHQHHHSASSNSYSTTSSPSLLHETSQQRYSSMTIPPLQRIPPSGQMVTVVKTLGPPAVQNVQSKDFFNNMYGTKEGVKHLKGTYGPANLSQAKINHGIDQELEEVRLANEHFLHMRKNGRCQVPVAEVVCVKELYPSDTKEYLPRCTLLHRCGDKSGCCDSDILKCVPKAIQEVALNFYTILLDSRPPETNIANSVEKLLFENHTECECAPIEDRPVVTQESYSSKTAVTETTSPSTTTTTTTTTTVKPVIDHEPQKDHHSQDTASSQTMKCRECPLPFCRREYEDGRCSCDCFDKQKPCLRIKRGREALQEVERRCVETGKCHIPECEYGTYNYSLGKCPKKDFTKPTNKYGHSRNPHHPNHRWGFVERD